MSVYRQHDTIIHTAALYLSDDLVIHVLEKGKEEGHAGPWLGGTNTTSSHIETELNWPLLCLTPMLYQKSSLFSKDVQGRTVVHFAPLGERSLAFLKWFKDVGAQYSHDAWWWWLDSSTLDLQVFISIKYRMTYSTRCPCCSEDGGGLDSWRKQLGHIQNHSFTESSRGYRFQDMLKGSFLR